MRAELFSVGQLERHAKSMAEWHEVALASGGRGGANTLLARLAANGVALSEGYALVTEAVERGRQITPAAEWFIDNYPLIEEQIRTARKHLPRDYNRELPRLANGSSPATPRVYDIALELISHSHGRVDSEGLRAFVAAYQTVAPLRLGELWAIPIMLRLALIENLRRVVAAVTAGRRDRESAAYWVGEMVDVAASDPAGVVLVLADMVEESPILTNAFVAELASRLQGQGAALVLAMSWLEQRLAEQAQTVDQVFHQASQSQAADQVSIGNSIGSLRFLSATDWRDFVEAMSVVEQTLREDPSGAYTTMDFATRDRYRHVVEQIARRTSRAEGEVAKAAVDLSRRAQRNGAARLAHVGYFLIDRGRRSLEREVRATSSVSQRLQGVAQWSRIGLYGGAILLLTAVATVLLGRLAGFHTRGWSAAAWWVLLAICASQVAISFVHWAATILVPPKVLPRLDFASGIPTEHRTVVAVPTMLTDLDEVDAQAGALEVRYLANRDPNLSFALLSDFRDAPTETVSTDDALLGRARLAIEALNTKYCRPNGPACLSACRTATSADACWRR